MKIKVELLMSVEESPKFAIIYTATNSIFGGGRGQVALVLFELLNFLKINVTFIHVSLTEQSIDFQENNTCPWWKDCYVPENINTIQLTNVLKKNLKYDYLIDIDGLILHEIRQKIANKTIVFYRKSFLINEIENAVYLQNSLPLNILGANIIWMWEEFNKNEEEMLKSIFPCPLFFIPYTWSSKPLDFYLSKCQQQSNTQSLPVQSIDFILLDKNQDNQSNSIIPITALYNVIRNMNLEDSKKISSISILNGEQNLKKSDYFETNIIKNTFGLIKSCHKLEFLGRQRIADIDPKSQTLPVVISHIRFQPFQPFMLDLAWMNITFIHNSLFMAKIHPKFEKYYYPESSIQKSSEIIRGIITQNIDYSPNDEIHNIIRSRFFPESNLPVFKKIFQETLNDYSTNLLESVIEKPIISSQSSEYSLKSSKIYQVLFVDMYDGFEPANNFFMDLFEAHNFNVTLFNPENNSEPDFIIQGPFFSETSQNNLYSSKIPRIFFTGENETIVPINRTDSRIKLFLSFQLKEDERNMRLPIWIFYLDWFQKLSKMTDLNQIRQFPRNPGISPLVLATEPNPIPFDSRKEFCSFVVSNPNSNIRNLFFKKLSSIYKRVNSAGKFLNNIGGPIESKYPGGGQGDAAKHNYLTQHRFNICFENLAESGYITEKVLQAKLAGCVPLYWGEQNIDIDFDSRGIVNLSGKSLSEMIQQVKYLEENPLEAKKIAETPALSDELVIYWRNRLAEIASRIRIIVETSKKIPETQKVQSLVFLTYFSESTSQKDLQLFEFSLRILGKSLQQNNTLEYYIYYHPNIEQDLFDKLLNISKNLQNIKIILLKFDISQLLDNNYSRNFFSTRCEILRQASINPLLENKTVVYQIHDCTWTKIPEFMSTVLDNLENPILFLRDFGTKNSQIAPAAVRTFLQITSDELYAPVVVPDIIIFRGGSLWVTKFFNLMASYICHPEILNKSAEVSMTNNEIIVNKYDIIVWSIFVKRFALANINIDDIADLLSLRSAFKNAKSVYIHRGKFIDIHRIFPNIDNICLINLDRRKDRLNSFYNNNSGLIGFVERVKAVDGKEIKLDKSLVKLFCNNNFSWKKSVMGCALSHYNIWNSLVAETSHKINNYMILEDDVRFINTFQSDMVDSLKKLPDDWDILYLGGVLPINREQYPHVLEKECGNWYKILPNPFFSGNETLLPIFHHCTYSYIINKKAAQKLLKLINENGIYTSLDHLLMSLALVGGKIFVHYPSVTYSFQDEDDDYKSTEFDNFNRIVKYDSDIWNNTDCFTEKDIEKVLC